MKGVLNRTADTLWLLISVLVVGLFLIALALSPLFLLSAHVSYALVANGVFPEKFTMADVFTFLALGVGPLLIGAALLFGPTIVKATTGRGKYEDRKKQRDFFAKTALIFASLVAGVIVFMCVTGYFG